MKLIAIVFVAVLFCLQDAHLGTEKKFVPPHRAESSAYIVRGKNGLTYVTENRSFRFAEVLGDTGNYEAVLLLEETYHNERTDGIEGMQGNATVKAWTVKRDGSRELRWTFQETGNEGDVEGRFFRVTAWGCCDIPARHDVSVFSRTTYFFGGQWCKRLAGTHAPGAKEIFKTLTREQVIAADGLVSRIGYGHPRFTRNENDGVRTCHTPLVADGYRCTAFFKNDHFFGIMVFVERNHRAGIQNFVSDVKVFGVTVLLIDLDDESRNRT